MANFINRHPRNVPGRFYVDADCTDCDLCRETAPNNIRRDDVHGYSYVYRQPTTAEEIALCEEGVEGCPTSAVGNDGESFDWQTTPIRDWTIYDEAMRPELAGLRILPLEEHHRLETPFGWPSRKPASMTDQELSELPKYPWMESRIPAQDALAAFVPNGSQPDLVITEMLERIGSGRWYPVEGGHRLLMPYEGGDYDSSRFTIEPGAWDHEHCEACGETIAPMTLCYVTEPEQPYILVCAACFEKHVASKQ